MAVRSLAAVLACGPAAAADTVRPSVAPASASSFVEDQRRLESDAARLLAGEVGAARSAIEQGDIHQVLRRGRLGRLLSRPRDDLSLAVSEGSKLQERARP